jgi:hypothetical protein
LLNPDFRDILSIFNEEGVEYLVIGAYALAAHGNPRATKDLDLWVRCSQRNSARIVGALRRFGAPLGDLTDQDFIEPGLTFQVGIAPRRIDVVTDIDGIVFEYAFPNRVTVEVDGIEVPVISRQDLLTNKKAARRPQDLADVAWLESNSKNQP